MSVELIATPNPHYIPGYTGFCPQDKFTIGDTYGTTTHKLLLDPAVSHAEKLIIADRTIDDVQALKPSQEDIDIVNARILHCDAVYKHPTIPGYDGCVPRMNSMFGQRYSVQATEALAEFERMQKSDLLALQKLLRQGALQNNKWNPKNLEDRELTHSDFKLPLLPVKRECVGILRNVPLSEPVEEIDHSASPYFMDNTDPEKYLKYGFAGHCPFSYAAFGQSNEPTTRSALCDFTTNYRRRLGIEWAPVSPNHQEPIVLKQPFEIYYRDTGLIPNYCGYVPGAMFRCGKTYGNDTTDAKRWLRGDYR